MKNGSILILSNDRDTGASIESKVKLLRECDDIRTAEYIEAVSILNTSQPSLIIVYCSNKDSIGIVKEIRSLKQLDKAPIILAMDYFIEELLLFAFDNGIDDFFFLNDSDSVILMRILLCLQKSILYRKFEISQDILASSGIIELPSGIFTKEHTPMVFKQFFGKCIEENCRGAVFMCIKPVSRQNKKAALQQMLQSAAGVIRNIPRGGDIIAYGRDDSFYFILYNAGTAGAKSVASRIKHALSSICLIYASAAEITSSFEEMEPVILKNIDKQIDAGIEFSYLYDTNIDENARALEIHDESGKKFTDFKKEFFQAFEQITSPVMHQIHKQAAKLFPLAKITFDITESCSWFKIEQDKIESSLFLSYPSYTKLIADIKHTADSKTPFIRRQTIDFGDFSQDMLLAMLMNVLREFEGRLNAGVKDKK